MTSSETLFVLIVVLTALATAIIGPFVPLSGNPGVYMPGPSDGVLPFQ